MPKVRHAQEPGDASFNRSSRSIAKVIQGHRHDEVCDGAFMQVGGVQSERDAAKTPNQPKNKFRYSYGA